MPYLEAIGEHVVASRSEQTDTGADPIVPLLASIK